MKIIFLHNQDTSFTYNQSAQNIKTELAGLVRELQLDPEFIAYDSRTQQCTKDDQPFQPQGDPVLIIYWTGMLGAARRDLPDTPQEFRHLYQEFFNQRETCSTFTLYALSNARQRDIEILCSNPYPAYRISFDESIQQIHENHKESLKNIITSLLPERAKQAANAQTEIQHESLPIPPFLANVPPPLVIEIAVAVAAAVIAATVKLALELTGTTIIFSIPQIDIALQDVVIAVSVLVILATIVGIVTSGVNKGSAPVAQ